MRSFIEASPLFRIIARYTTDPMFLRCGSQTLDLTTPVVMGILNVTPDSFSDGGRWLSPDAAISHGLAMAEAGAAMIDVGGESTRPGAVEVSEDEEMRRVVPVVAALAAQLKIPISVDTSRASVIRAVCAAGATFINDVRGLAQAGALEAVADTGAAVCVMHMQGQPNSMQAAPTYADVVTEVVDYLKDRIGACEEMGLAKDRIVVDPGIGFGKRVEHNLQLLRHLDRLTDLGFPVLVGVSRKSLVGALTGRAMHERLAGNLAFATAAALGGASIIRAHDVGPTVDAVKVAVALRRSSHEFE